MRGRIVRFILFAALLTALALVGADKLFSRTEVGEFPRWERELRALLDNDLRRGPVGRVEFQQRKFFSLSSVRRAWVEFPFCSKCRNTSRLRYDACDGHMLDSFARVEVSVDPQHGNAVQVKRTEGDQTREMTGDEKAVVAMLMKTDFETVVERNAAVLEMTAKTARSEAAPSPVGDDFDPLGTPPEPAEEDK